MRGESILLVFQSIRNDARQNCKYQYPSMDEFKTIFLAAQLTESFCLHLYPHTQRHETKTLIQLSTTDFRSITL